MMNKAIYSMFFLLLGLGAFAQKNNSARHLEQIVDRYKDASSLRMSFELIIEPVEQEEERYAGTFARKGASYFMDSDLQTVYSNGEDAWIYIPDNEEVQIVDADEDEGLPTPDNILDKFYNEKYKQRSRETESGRLLYEFVPLDTEEDVYKVQMIVDKSEKKIYEVKVFDKSASRYTIKMTDQEFGVDIPDETFVFDASQYPDVYVEDLRLD